MDLRLNHFPNKKFEEMSAKDIMTRNPITIAESLNVKESLEIMNEKKITSLLVFESGKLPKTKSVKLKGIVHIHYLLQYGIK